MKYVCGVTEAKWSGQQRRGICAMGNESSKGGGSATSGRKKLAGLSLRLGQPSSAVQRHLETTRKSRVLQLRNIGLKQLPEQVKEVQDILRNLDVSQNKLKTLPSFLGLFANLRQLHVSCNELNSLPDEIGLLGNLEILDVSSNQLTSVPHTLAELTSLTTLTLSRNRLTEFPIAVCHLPALASINLSANTIQSLPDEAKLLSVSELNLNQNRLSSLNPALVYCANLRTLRVEENCLSKDAFTADFLMNSKVSLIAYAGNLLQEKDFQGLPGYEEYQNRYTATKKKL